MFLPVLPELHLALAVEHARRSGVRITGDGFKKRARKRCPNCEVTAFHVPRQRLGADAETVEVQLAKDGVQALLPAVLGSGDRSKARRAFGSVHLIFMAMCRGIRTRGETSGRAGLGGLRYFREVSGSYFQFTGSSDAAAAP